MIEGAYRSPSIFKDVKAKRRAIFSVKSGAQGEEPGSFPHKKVTKFTRPNSYDPDRTTVGVKQPHVQQTQGNNFGCFCREPQYPLCLSSREVMAWPNVFNNKEESPHPSLTPDYPGTEFL